MKHLTFAKTLLTVFAAALTAVTQAHHSAAAFDRSKPYAMDGTVKRFNWAKPHAWIYL